MGIAKGRFPVHRDRIEEEEKKDDKLVLTLQPCSTIFIPKSNRSIRTGCTKCAMLLVKAGCVGYNKREQDQSRNLKNVEGEGEHNRRWIRRKDEEQRRRDLVSRDLDHLFPGIPKCSPDVINREYKSVVFFALRCLFPPMAFKRKI